MPLTFARRLLMLVGLVVTLVGTASAQGGKWSFPGTEWETEWEKVKPESEGYSSEKFAAPRGWLHTQQTTAMQVSVRGLVVF